MSITTIDTGACGVRPLGISSVGETGEDVCSVRPLRINPADDAGETVRKLRDKLEWYRRRRARQAGWTRRFIPTGLAPLDAVLPHGGVPCGAVTEILSDGSGTGAMSLVMRLGAQCIGESPTSKEVGHPPTMEAPSGTIESCVTVTGAAPSGAYRAQDHLDPRLAPWANVDRPYRACNCEFQARNNCSEGMESPTSKEVGHPSPKEAGHPSLACARGSDERCEKFPTSRQTDRSPTATDPANDDRCIIVVDAFGDFYPPAAWQHGIAPDRLIVLRATNARDALWAVDQALRCLAVAAVIAPFTHLDERESRRLQLAAETSGCIGLILRSAKRRAKSFAAVQMLVESTHGHEPNASASLHQRPDDSYPCRITLLAVREGMPAAPVWVDLRHETGIGPVHPVPVDRSAAKTA